WAFDAALAPLPYAPDSAKALLAAAGYTDRNGDGVLEDAAGRPLGFELTVAARNDFNRDVAELVRAQLAAIGVRVVPRFLDFAAMIDIVSAPERRFDAVFMMFESDFRLGLRDQFHSAAIDGPFQLASYRNAEVDRILDAAPRITDRTRALPLWHRLQRILRDEQPWTVLWYAPELNAARASLRGLRTDVRGTFADVAEWRLDPAPGAVAAAR
ncbi:MAG TPA: ABC transporter substrate-binding protein, partial [Longimicrobiales bacterium]|nr:ABC transporter substrate-binding protein [Longimicrobiales bacterium]